MEDLLSTLNCDRDCQGIIVTSRLALDFITIINIIIGIVDGIFVSVHSGEAAVWQSKRMGLFSLVSISLGIITSSSNKIIIAYWEPLWLSAPCHWCTAIVINNNTVLDCLRQGSTGADQFIKITQPRSSYSSGKAAFSHDHDIKL